MTAVSPTLGAAGSDVDVVALPAAPAGRGWWVMSRIEMVKLSAQFRVRILIAACVLGPLVVVVAEAAQSGVPADTLFGRWIHESGFADSLFILGFFSQWVIPLVIGAVAGDMFAEEDRHKTWSLLLTRSRARGDILIGKLLAISTYSITATVLLGLSATLSGALVVGTQPLVGLDGTLLSSSAAWAVTIESWATMLPPVLVVMGIGVIVSVLSRNSWVGVILPLIIVFVFNVVLLMSAIDPVRPFLPTTGFYAWYGLARTTAVYTNQIWASLLVSAGWVALCLGLASFAFLRRDVVDA
jgi:ABC-2 type transport system permease protein